MELIGFTLHKQFFDDATEENLIKEIDSQQWIVDYDRKLQYYGYRNELESPFGLIEYPIPIPTLIRELANEIFENDLLKYQPDQVIINEYLPGQGIRPHKDRNYYENQICGVNLGSDCIMRFTRNKVVVDIEIPRRSIYIMQDDARSKWLHSIPPRKKDKVDGTIKIRDRRISITYRKVKIDKVKPINPFGKVASMLKNYGNLK